TAEGTVLPAALTFTTTNWATPQTVTVTGVDDSVVDADVAYAIATGAATSTDSNYSGLNPADVPVTNLNNDTALGVADVGTDHHYGQPTTFTATVFGLNGHATTGSVVFSYGALGLGSFPVVNGVATMSTSLLPIGADTVSAFYSGDAFYFSTSGSTDVVIGLAQLSVTANPQN